MKISNIDKLKIVRMNIGLTFAPLTITYQEYIKYWS